MCPRCGSGIDTGEQRWRCENGRNCHLVASLSYAVGRDQLDVEGLGHTWVVQLVEAGLVADLADLFVLTREQLLGLERMGETSTDNLLAALDTAKGRPLSRVLCALGVRGTGRSLSRRIARYFATMDNIRAADAEAIQRVEGIGTEKAPSIVAELAELAPLIDKLVAAGVNMTEPGATPPAPADEEAADTEGGVEPAGGPLAGMAVVVTGAMTGVLERLSRNQMNELIERAGGRASSSVSKKTSLVVAGENAAPSAPRPRPSASAWPTRTSSPPSSPTSSNEPARPISGTRWQGPSEAPGQESSVDRQEHCSEEQRLLRPPRRRQA